MNKNNEIYQVLTIKKPNYKSLMDICSVKVYNEKHFNWFEKIMWRLLLGIKITDVGGEELEDNTEEIEEIELIGTNFMDMDKNQLKDEINKNRIFIKKLRQEIFELRKEKNND